MRKIPFSPPDIGDEEIKLVIETLKSGWITTGPKTKEFEREIAMYCQTDRAVCLNSATASLEMTMRLLGIGEGDEIITSAYTYTATCSTIIHTGAKPVLIDVKENSTEMDYNALADAITDRTKAVIPVDIGGVVCDYKTIFDIVNDKKHLFKPCGDIQNKMGRIAVLADAAHSFGAEKNGVKSGNIADFTSFSFHAVKNLTTAEGGAVTWRNIDGIDNDYLYNEYQLLSLHGQSKDALEKLKPGAWEYDIKYPAYKCNMTDISAALGLAQLKRYDDILNKRKKYIDIYNSELKDMVLPLNHYDDTHKSSGHLYMCRLGSKDRAFRDKMIVELAKHGVSANVHYKPLPMHTAYINLGFDIKDYPNSKAFFENEISLPLNTKMTENDVHYVCDVFKEVYSYV